MELSNLHAAGNILLIVITASSVTGTVIPQREETALYFELYGRFMAPALLGLGLTDVFHSPWFIFLALLLGLNLAFCTVGRSRRSLLRLSGPELKNTPDKLKTAVDIRNCTFEALIWRQWQMS